MSFRRATLIVMLLLVFAFFVRATSVKYLALQVNAVREAGARGVFVQGSLLPHAGYSSNVLALHHRIVPPRGSAFLLCATCNPYPFTKDEIAARIHDLQSNEKYEAIRYGDLILFRSRA